jgi:glucose/arabinose dehydrogenase
MTRPLSLLLVALCAAPAFAQQAADAEIPDTQDTSESPILTPAEALGTVRVPAGFHVTLFASEPQVRQPIGMAFDGRGRLWVAENYTYAEHQTNFDTSLHDRIVVLEDTDHDGQADRDTVFWDGAQQLTSTGWRVGIVPTQSSFPARS